MLPYPLGLAVLRFRAPRASPHTLTFSPFLRAEAPAKSCARLRLGFHAVQVTVWLDDIAVTKTNDLTLKDYGWNAHFQAQLFDDEIVGALPVRVLAVHRDALDVAGPGFEGRVLPLAAADEEEAGATVGDWLLIDTATRRPLRVLERRSVFKRKGAGKDRRVQLIAANVDTLLLVTSANHDFNEARLERYLALASEAQSTPVVVITKADLTGELDVFVTAARRLMPGLVVEAFDAREAKAVSCLAPWFGRGQTVALLGSSGVGKSTIVNTLAGDALQHTQGIRGGDDKGRHTTTGRSLHRLANGTWLMDTPGMRELQLVDVAKGLDDVFADVADLATARTTASRAARCKQRLRRARWRPRG